jgi:hypothetical protein
VSAGPRAASAAGNTKAAIGRAFGPAATSEGRSVGSGGPAGPVMSRSMVYKLHFWPPYKHAAHYTGKSDRLPERLTDHTLGRGARLTQVQLKAGGSWVIGLIEAGGTARERQIKGHDAARYCGVCQAQKGYQAGQLSQQEALARAGWDRASQYERGLLLDILGIGRPPQPAVTAPDVPALRPAPDVQVRQHISPELEAVVDALIAGWTSPKAEPGREAEAEPEAGQ